ncbi:exodeoxyribonuclease VII small subunit [Pseudohongiella acticola]|uniref:Exodeoxyribonuclease 7 small subunit n=1 Tax=Pseudohongiella acticola TaxID=1524254 RepID=A0A1E8CJL1_9GAMM|nr:exodeoxyribonuclease VII small subunit [Pseudohongiella acticola]OFE12671.1 exodeoxyribonuclease VII small subunit [Pseudohongiella acticola]
MATSKTTKTRAEAPSAQGFEESLAQLETLVSDMEDGNLSLEEALSAFETGIKLTRQCQQALQAAELKVQMLSNPDGEPSAMALDEAADEEAGP